MKDLLAMVVFLLVMISGVGISFSAPVTTTGYATVDELRSSVLSLDKVIRNTTKAISENSKTSFLTARDIRERKEFALYLQTRIAVYCEQLASQLPAQFMADLPCPLLDRAEVPNVFLLPPATTDEEEIDSLEQQLTESIGAFDEMLLAEETRIASHRPTSPQSGQRDTGGQGQMQESVQAEKEAAVGDKGRSRHEETGEAAGGQDRVATGAGQGHERKPSVQKNGNQGTLVVDDDIVARQLKEAAEKEPDPQLKEKLWQEYWKYKGKKM